MLAIYIQQLVQIHSWEYPLHHSYALFAHFYLYSHNYIMTTKQVMS